MKFDLFLLGHFDLVSKVVNVDRENRLGQLVHFVCRPISTLKAESATWSSHHIEGDALVGKIVPQFVVVFRVLNLEPNYFLLEAGGLSWSQFCRKFSEELVAESRRSLVGSGDS